MWKRATHAGTTFLHPDFGPPSYGIPYAVVGAGHAKVSVNFTYANESDPGPYPFGPDIPIEGGSDRHALVIDQQRLPALRAVRSSLERWGSEGGERRDLPSDGSEGEPAATGGMDERRCGGTADLRRPVALRRGEGGVGRSRDPDDRRLYARRLHLAGSTCSRNERSPMPADGGSVPASCLLRRRAVRAERPRCPPSDETVRAHRRRQRERLVLPRSGRLPLDLPLRRSVEADPGERLRRRRRTRVQGGGSIGGVRLRAGMPGTVVRTVDRGSSRRSSVPRV